MSTHELCCLNAVLAVHLNALLLLNMDAQPEEDSDVDNSDSSEAATAHKHNLQPAINGIQHAPPPSSSQVEGKEKKRLRLLASIREPVLYRAAQVPSICHLPFDDSDNLMLPTSLLHNSHHMHCNAARRVTVNHMHCIYKPQQQHAVSVCLCVCVV